MLGSKDSAGVGPHNGTEKWGPGKSARETAYFLFRGDKSYTDVKIGGQEASQWKTR